MGVQNGRWYWEVKVTTGNSANAFTGIVAEDVDYLDATVYDETGLLLYFVDGRKTVDGSDTESFFDSLATDDIVGVHLDLDSSTKQVTFTKNGYGNFEYPPNISTTKYYALCTKNLAEFG